MKLSTVGWAATVLGLLMAVPSSAILIVDPPDADHEVVFTPAVRIPLASINKSRSTSAAFQVPPRWREMRSDWGDPRYLTHVRLADRALSHLSYEQLGVRVAIVRSGLVLDSQTPPYAPYGFDSEIDTLGFVVKANPADQLSVEVSLDPGVTLPAGELVVEPFADSSTKDRIVGGLIDADIRPWAKRLLPSALVLMTLGTVLVAFGRRRSDPV
jgi:hypothetical protein